MQLRTIVSSSLIAAPWLGLTALIGLVDYLTPSTYAFASIYFIPIFAAAWRSRTVGFVVAAASSFAWMYSDYIHRPVTDIDASSGTTRRASSSSCSPCSSPRRCSASSTASPISTGSVAAS